MTTVTPVQTGSQWSACIYFALVLFGPAHSSAFLDDLCSKGGNSANKLELKLSNNNNPANSALQQIQEQRMQLRPVICFALDALRGNITLINSGLNLPSTSPLRSPLSSLILLPFPLALLYQFQAKEKLKIKVPAFSGVTQRALPIVTDAVDSTTSKATTDIKTVMTSPTTVETETTTDIETTSIESTTDSSSTETTTDSTTTNTP